MKTQSALLAVVLLAGGCSLGVEDLNNPSLDALEVNPSREKFEAATLGLLAGNRLDYAESNGYVTILGVLGREAYNFDPGRSALHHRTARRHARPRFGAFRRQFLGAAVRQHPERQHHPERARHRRTAAVSRCSRPRRWRPCAVLPRPCRRSTSRKSSARARKTARRST